MNIVKMYKIEESRMKRPVYVTNTYRSKDDFTKSTQITNSEKDDTTVINGFDVLSNSKSFILDNTATELYSDKQKNIIDLPKLIKKYREVANQSYVDEAIDIIVEEMSFSDDKGDVVELDLNEFVEKHKNEKLAEKIQNKFKKILDLMEFNENSYQYMRDWYIDGRVVFECVYDIENGKINKNGISKIIQVDPILIEKYFEIETEKEIFKVKKIDYNKYSESSYSQMAMHHDLSTYNNMSEVIADDFMIVYVDSGLKDRNKGIYTSYLHRILKPINQLKTLEDSILIYRLARSPQRRVFFVDVGKSNRAKAESYIRDVKMSFDQKEIIDADGEIITTKALHNIMEDYFIPRYNGSNATEVSTIEGQNNLGDLGDLSYFLEKLYKGLRIPKSRLENSGSSMAFDGESDITQEELKFNRFINRLRGKFRRVFLQLLRNELITTGMFGEDDWNTYKKYFKIVFTKNSYYNEKMENKILKDRIDMLKTLAGDDAKIINVYYPEEWIWSKIFKYTDDDINEIKKLIADKNVSLEQSEVPEGENISLSDENMSGGSGFDIGSDEEMSDEEMSDEDFESEISDELDEPSEVGDMDEEPDEDVNDEEDDNE